MNINLRKDNKPSIRALSKEEQISLESVSLSYSELGDTHIIAMILGHGVDELTLEMCETEYEDSVLALMMACKKLNLMSVETCNSSVRILSAIFPNKGGLLRRAKMLGKDLKEVLKDVE